MKGCWRRLGYEIKDYQPFSDLKNVEDVSFCKDCCPIKKAISTAESSTTKDSKGNPKMMLEPEEESDSSTSDSSSTEVSSDDDDEAEANEPGTA